MAMKGGCCSIPSGKIYIGAWGGLLQSVIAAGIYYSQLSLLARLFQTSKSLRSSSIACHMTLRNARR